MSRGPGRIERAIEAAFRAEPSRAFTVEALALVVFRGINRIEKKHRVAVLRAAHSVAERSGWRVMREGGLSFYNPVELRSYAQAMLRFHARGDTARGITAGLERNLYALDDPSIKVDWRQYMEPGSSWWEVVEIERCRRSGDHARADELQAKRDAEIDGFKARLAALAGSNGRRTRPSWHLVDRHVRYIRGKRVTVGPFERGGRRDRTEGSA